MKQNDTLSSIISVDITRYGAQVISGVGFLGAGIIVFKERKVSGLTTAVMMWNVTIIGLVIGMGFLNIAFVNLCATIGILILAHFKRKNNMKKISLILLLSTTEKKQATTSQLYEKSENLLGKEEQLVSFIIENLKNEQVAKLSYYSKEDFWKSNIHDYFTTQGKIKSVVIETI